MLTGSTYRTDTREEQMTLTERIRTGARPMLAYASAERDSSIVDRFERMAALLPSHTVVKSESQSITYDQLNRRANRLAHTLVARLGTGAGPVGMVLGHDIDMVVALLGILKSGKFYVPLDPEYPLDRIKYMVADSGTRFIVTDRANMRFAAGLTSEDAGVMTIEDVPVTAPDRDLGLEIKPGNYSYLLYTSGSTGLPKGVIENHRDVKIFTGVALEQGSISPSDVLSGFWSVSSSGLATHLYMSLLGGGCLLLVDAKRVGIRRLNDLMREHRVSILSFVPSLFRAMADAENISGGFPYVRLARFGGAAADIKDVRRFFDVSPQAYLRHSYGMSELKHLGSYIFTRESRLPDDLLPIGYTVNEVEVRLVDDQGVEVRQGQVGEVIARSIYVCPGYWNLPELDAERFHGDANGGPNRYFKTGDMALRDANGCLYHKGRKDFQAKIRGFRVELQEVEDSLRMVGGVRAAAVRVWKGDNEEHYLVGYVVPDGDMPLTADLRRVLSVKLPAYMVPAVFMEMTELPMTPVGKLDRNRLPEPPPPQADSGSPADYRLASDVEREIAQLWSDVLNTTHLRLRDEFLDVGGESLKAARLLGRVESKFKVKVPFAEFYEASTIEAQAMLVSRLLSASQR